MAQDAYGNYIVSLTTPPVFPLPGSIGGSVQTITGTWADPNGHVTPDDPTLGALYYQDPAIDLYNEWKWNVGTQHWDQSSGV